ncbi:MAG TPA: DUF4150 domain-containing protein [Nannocystis sp.]|jgi:hypothetical protein
MSSVFANGRSILHSGDGLKHVAAPPDVCKTPSPGGPVPIPYVNLASDSDLSRGTKGVKIEGSSVALADSHLRTSTGDEPGTAGGGIISAKTKGKMGWGTSSADVRFEGKGVARFMDITRHNGNSYNDAFKARGGTGLAYADDFQGPCPICKKGPREHRIPEKLRSHDLCKRIVDGLKAAYADPARKKGVVKRGYGYMVGVMICKCGQTFAATSGWSPSGFQTVAADVVDEVIQQSSVSLDELIRANKTKKAAPATKRQKLSKAWQEVEDKRAVLTADAGYNVPGSCAAAKLLTRGHAPLELTEMMFWPKGTWSQEYDLLTTKDPPPRTHSWRKAILQNRRATKVKSKFSSAANPPTGVASCHTCQTLLYMTNCPKRSC